MHTSQAHPNKLTQGMPNKLTQGMLTWKNPPTRACSLLHNWLLWVSQRPNWLSNCKLQPITYVTFILLVTHRLATRYHLGLSLAQWYCNPLLCGWTSHNHFLTWKKMSISSRICLITDLSSLVTENNLTIFCRLIVFGWLPTHLCWLCSMTSLSCCLVAGNNFVSLVAISH